MKRVRVQLISLLLLSLSMIYYLSSQNDLNLGRHSFACPAVLEPGGDPHRRDVVVRRSGLKRVRGALMF